MNTYPLNEEQMFKDLRGLMQIKTINRNCGPMTDQMPLGEGVDVYKRQLLLCAFYPLLSTPFSVSKRFSHHPRTACKIRL